MNEKEFSELAAGRALNALSDADHQRFTDALRAHPEWSAMLEHDRETAAALASSAAAETPPPALRAALLAEIASTAQGEAEPEGAPAAPVSKTASSTGRPKRRNRALFALAAAVVLIAGIGIGSAVLLPQLTAPASVVALQEIEAASDAQQVTVELESGARATAHWSTTVGNAVLVTDGLDDLDEGLTYELWFVRGEQPIAAGVFDPDAGSATALLEGEMHAGDVIAVTVEQDGGSPDGQPTTDPVIVIPTA
ncbi:anti-sigma factor [uncultured Microbacterium sp.]|uniref:anti-sigma factor n=1 Tax=uncultured Microbacterium sp. TaxID=191216 RepID=UPI002638C1CE|nr:anti-sigma factor [uncultured Microbacterium sp.]